MWRNWYTRALQKRMEQSLRVQISPCPQSGLARRNFNESCFCEQQRALPRRSSLQRAKAGRSIPVVRILREDVDWVRFPAARQLL
jgi:hypothetical protein